MPQNYCDCGVKIPRAVKQCSACEVAEKLSYKRDKEFVELEAALRDEQHRSAELERALLEMIEGLLAHELLAVPRPKFKPGQFVQRLPKGVHIGVSPKFPDVGADDFIRVRPLRFEEEIGAWIYQADIAAPDGTVVSVRHEPERNFAPLRDPYLLLCAAQIQAKERRAEAISKIDDANKELGHVAWAMKLLGKEQP